MPWQELILLATVFNALGMITLRVLAREKQTANASFVISAGCYVTIYAAMLLLLPWIGHVHTQAFREYWWRFVGGGFAFALTNVFIYKTLVYFDVAIANIVGTINAVFAVIGAAVFLGEDLSTTQFIGAAILLPAIAYGVLATHVTRKKSVRRSVKLGLMYALLAGLCYGVAMVNEKSLLGHMATASYIVFGVGCQLALITVSAILLQHNKLRLLLRPRVAGWSALSGALRGFGGACVILTEVKSNNLALASVISNFRLIVVILLGAWLLKEHQHLRQKFAAAAIAIAGLTVMFWK
jgi:drug/metabolite transporter (DMT)-like permease